MGLLVECPQCRKRNSLKAKTCTGKLVECPQCKKRYSPHVKMCPRCKKLSGSETKNEKKVRCGTNLNKTAGKVYWIDYFIDGYRRRERIGPSKAAAEQRLREVLSAKVEGRYIRKSPDGCTLFKDLARWYLALPEVKAKRSYGRDQEIVAKLVAFFGDRLLRDITPSLVEAYRQKRLQEPSTRTGHTRGDLTAPATVNREIACLKTIFNKAIRNGRAERHPCRGVKMLKENNERDRVLSVDEYHRLLAACPPHLEPVVKLAYHTGMRQGEILGLKWSRVDLKEGLIRLKPEDTKTGEGRDVPLTYELVEMFQSIPSPLYS